MGEPQGATEDHYEPGRYEIRIKGHLDDRWADRFDGLTITREATDETLLTGRVADQSALHGWLRTVRDLALPLVSVMAVDPKPAAVPDVQPEHRSRSSRSEIPT